MKHDLAVVSVKRNQQNLGHTSRQQPTNHLQYPCSKHLLCYGAESASGLELKRLKAAPEHDPAAANPSLKPLLQPWFRLSTSGLLLPQLLHCCMSGTNILCPNGGGRRTGLLFLSWALHIAYSSGQWQKNGKPLQKDYHAFPHASLPSPQTSCLPKKVVLESKSTLSAGNNVDPKKGRPGFEFKVMTVYFDFCL